MSLMAVIAVVVSNHEPAECKFKDAQCHSCGKAGHIAPVCRSKATVSKKDRAGQQAFGSRSSDPITVAMTVNGKKLTMEVDTGAVLSVI